MESLSLVTFWAALGASIASTFLYWDRALGLRASLKRLLRASGAINGRQRPFNNSAETHKSVGGLTAASAWLTTVLLAISVISRWKAAGHAPWSNMWEFTLAFAGTIALAYVLFERWSRGSSHMLGSIAMPVVVAILAASAIFFPSDIRPLVPALQNQDLLVVHASMMVIAYGVLSLSFGASVIYLVQGGERNRFSQLPSGQRLDEIAYQSVIVGFPLLTLGIVLGAYWASDAWGRYWGWDPKETAALATLLIYAGYLHMRGLRSWTGTRSAFVLIVGFLGILFTYFAVNLWVQGLHSYAGV